MTVASNPGEGEADLNAYRARVAAVIAAEIAPLVAEAELNRAFPRAAVRALGVVGAFHERWAGPGHGDLQRSVILAEELGRTGLGGIGVGISLHAEAVLAILQRFGTSETVRACAAGALAGELVGCLATSEDHVGSDLTSVETTLAREDGGWRLRGRKRYVSPGAAADFALVLCRVGDEERGLSAARMTPLALALVRRDELRVEHRLETVGMRGLETVSLVIDAHIDEEEIVGRHGTALLAVSWGLGHERLALAAQVLGGAEFALGLTVAHLKRRRQFGATLMEHQALRLRIADLAAQVSLARRGVHAAAGELAHTHRDMTREVAGIKVTAARLGERVLSECLHLFGGAGYLEDETPLARLWRDVRVGRLGAGSDEMMWELVAGGLKADDAAYDALITVPS